MASLRNKLSALVLWCVFLVLYLGGVVMLVIGLVLASRIWWAAIHQHASLWALSEKSVEALALGLGLLLILIIPLFHRRSVDRSGVWRSGQRTDTDCRIAADEDGPLMTL